MQDYAFRGISTEANIVLSGNVIREIPAGAFEGRQNSVVDLQNLGIQTINADAFTGTHDLEILLGGNSVSRLFPNSFPTGAVQGGQTCTDYIGWSEYCSELVSETRCDQQCSGDTSPYVVSSLGVSAVDACCGLGGGFVNGANLIMDEISPITCSSAHRVMRSRASAPAKRRDIT